MKRAAPGFYRYRWYEKVNDAKIYDTSLPGDIFVWNYCPFNIFYNWYSSLMISWYLIRWIWYVLSRYPKEGGRRREERGETNTSNKQKEDRSQAMLASQLASKKKRSQVKEEGRAATTLLATTTTILIGYDTLSWY